MKNVSFLLLALLLNSSIYGQLYLRNQRKVVFADKTNIRDTTSVHAKIIGTLKQGTEVIICEKEYATDSINGVKANWVPILYNGLSGYVWGYTLASNSFTHTNGNRLLVKNDNQGVAYKVFAGDSIISSGTYTDKPYAPYSYCYEIEPISALKNNVYFKLNDSDQLYSFDGKKVVRAGRCKNENINLHHQSLVEEVKDSLGSIINRNKVNFRRLPSKDSEILGQLSQYSFVQEVEKLTQRETINNEDNYWYKIKWNGKVGYVWGSSISSPKQHVYDNDDKNTSYLLCNNGLYVLHNKKIVAHTLFKSDIYDETVLSFGDKGFGSGYDFVAVESLAHSCGEWGGDTYFLWNGKEIKGFCSDGGVGDGGLSEGENYVFPSDKGGIPGKVIRNSYSSELIDISPVDGCEEKYASAIDYSSSTIMIFNGDSLIEVPSKHSELKKLVKNLFPKYNLVQYKLADINNDQIEDAVFQITMSWISKDYDGNEQTSYKTKMGIALGVGKDSLKLYKVNEHFIGENEHRISIEVEGSDILITSYSPYKIGQWDNSIFGRKIYRFVYSSTDQKIYWESVSAIFSQGLQKLSFKSKKVLFENTWNAKEYFNQDY